MSTKPTTDKIIKSQEPSVGLVIGTYGAIPFIHLHLESWKRHYPHIPVLVHDDASPWREELRELCLRYEADFVSFAEPLGYILGDLSAFLAGFDWAVQRGIDLLVKMSRRFVPVANWVPELQARAVQTQYATYGNHCAAQGMDLRPECMAFHVPSWSSSGAVEALRQQVASQHPEGSTELVMHNLARLVHQNNCAQNIRWEKAHPQPSRRAGYGEWALPGDNRQQRLPDALWHQADTSLDYCRALRQYGLLYPLWHLADVKGARSMLEDEFLRVKGLVSDIHEHLDTLVRLGSECQHITEFGMHSAISTTAFLYSWPEALITYHRVAHQGLGALRQTAREVGIDFEFVEADRLAVEIAETDLLFIDTVHTYEQLQQELRLHAEKVRRYLVFHDTVSYGIRGEIPDSVGLLPAITEFLDGHPEWEIAEKYDNNNGLLVLRRRPI